MLRYAAAAALVGLAALLRWSLIEAFGPGLPPFNTFFPAVAVAAALGVGPGLLATATAGSVIGFLLLQQPVIGGEIAGLVVFLSTSLLLSLLGGGLRAARARDRHFAAALRTRTAAMDATAEMVVITDAEGCIQYVNPAFTQNTGYTPSEAVGRNPRFLKSDQQSPEFYRDLWSTIRRGEVWRGELINRRKDGTTYTEEMTITPMTGQDGHISDFIAVKRDVTERKRTEQTLAALNESLEQRVADRTGKLRELNAELMRAEQRERARLAQVLHDGLQQFLVAAKMQVGLAARQPNPAALRTAEQLLDQSIEASRTLAVDLSPPVLRQAGIAGALEWLSRWMKDKHGLTVCVDITGPRFQAEPELRTFLFEAAREMLLNVSKHAGTDAATVSLERVDHHVRLSIEDEGRGFDPTASRDGPVGGTGLLAIGQRVELMGGRFQVDSAPGRGTRVGLIVPIAVDEEPIEDGPSPVISLRNPERRRRDRKGARVRVLVADDHAVLRQGVAAALAGEPGIELVGEAANGAEAVDLVAEVVPDVLLMDITMPVMDGIEATRRIHGSHPSVRIVGLSMHDERDVIDRMMEAGAVAFVTKGAPMEELIRAVHPSRAPADDPPPLAARPAASGRRREARRP